MEKNKSMEESAGHLPPCGNQREVDYHEDNEDNHRDNVEKEENTARE